MNSSDYTIELSESFTVRDVDNQQLHFQLDDILIKTPEISSVYIDMGKLNRVDACAIQYLVTLPLTYRDRGLALMFVNPSGESKKVISLLGLNAYFSFSDQGCE